MTNVVFICPVVNGHNGKGATSTNAAGTRNPIGKHEKSNPMTNRPVLESGMTISHLARKKNQLLIPNQRHQDLQMLPIQMLSNMSRCTPMCLQNTAGMQQYRKPVSNQWCVIFCNKINGTFNQSQSGSNGTLAPDEISKVQQSPESSTAHAD